MHDSLQLLHYKVHFLIISSTDRAVGSPLNRSILGTVSSPQQYPYMRTVASFLSFRCFQFASKSFGDPVLGLGERIRDYGVGPGTCPTGECDPDRHRDELIVPGSGIHTVQALPLHL